MSDNSAGTRPRGRTVREVFIALIRDDGVVSVTELRAGLDRLGLEVTQEELNTLMELYDVNSGEPPSPNKQTN